MVDAATVGAAVVVVLLLVLLLRRYVLKRAYERYTCSNVTTVEVHAPATPPQDTVRRVLVTGGCGFLGRYIVNRLVAARMNVTVMDVIVPPPAARVNGVTYVRGNLLNLEHIAVAIRASGQRADSVLHVASLIPFLGVPDAAVFRINVDGTANVARASEQAGVPALMYTSSATVALDRDVVHARKLTEESPPPRTHLDTYTTTKAAAEKIVVDANGSGVTTCVLRPAAIFGRGDKLLSDVTVAKQYFVLGAGKVLIDWVGVENVAHAHVLAEAALHADAASRKRLGGQVYNIGNEEEMAYGAFLGRLPEGASGLSHWGHPPPVLMPLAVVTALATLNELSCTLTGFPLMQASLSRLSIQYTQRSYTFSSEKAARHFGYKPLHSVGQYIEKLRTEYAAAKK